MFYYLLDIKTGIREAIGSGKTLFHYLFGKYTEEEISTINYLNNIFDI